MDSLLHKYIFDYVYTQFGLAPNLPLSSGGRGFVRSGNSAH